MRVCEIKNKFRVCMTIQSVWVVYNDGLSNFLQWYRNPLNNPRPRTACAARRGRSGSLKTPWPHDYAVIWCVRGRRTSRGRIRGGWCYSNSSTIIRYMRTYINYILVFCFFYFVSELCVHKFVLFPIFFKYKFFAV